jgi:hypothetical protein
MKSIYINKWANWLSRIIRWGLAAAFIGLAIAYDHEPVLYAAGAIAFITGFFNPRRCTAASCNR